MLLVTKEKTPAAYNTKWDDLHPDSQKLLLQIEERILEYKDESERLEQCSRLYVSSEASETFELGASQIMQELGGIANALEREKVSLQEMMDEVHKLLWNTEVAVKSYMILRPRFIHPNVSSTSNITPANQPTGATMNSSSNNQESSNSMFPVYEFYSGIPKRPSQFMQHTVARFEKYLAECCQWIDELEQLVLLDSGKMSNSGLSSIQALPSIMANVHQYFVHVAAKVENLHQYIESMKNAYLGNQRRHGDGNDPFLEADRREIAKQEAAARRVHPTLHLPSVAQPSTQGASLFSSSGAPVSSVQQQSLGSSQSATASSIFNTPASSAAPSTSLFFTPTASTSTSTLFGSSGFSPQSTPFGTTSTAYFGSAQTPSLVGNSTPAVSATPLAGTSLFSTPFLAGSSMGSGSSFGGASNKSRQKARGTRR